MVSLLFSDGTRIKDKGTPEEEVAAAYRQWKEAQETARKAAAQKPQRGKVTVEDVCRVYLRTPRRTFMRFPSISAAIATAASVVTLPERNSTSGLPFTISASTRPPAISVAASESQSRTCLRPVSANIPACNRLSSGRHNGSTSGRRRQPVAGGTTKGCVGVPPQ